jgi:glycosyltransferase involved in cell wall biosynthesis
VAPTGTVLPSREWTGGRPELLWIGRYSTAHKGLDLLLQALASVPADTRPLLLMRGTDYRGGKAEVEGLVSSLGLAGHVTVGPPVGGEEKESLLLECAGYVQPSRWESHSIGLLEALSRATPSLISDRMPISADVAAAGAALVSPLEPAELGRQLVTLAAGQPELGAVGRRFVAEHFDWKPVMVHYEQELAALC